MNWSTFQSAIFDFIASPAPEPGAVNAVAGGAKTTTLVEAVRRTRGRTLVVAFNKHIAVELERRLGKSDDRTISTLHALGLRALSDACTTRPKVTSSKYLDIADWALDQHPNAWREAGFDLAYEAKLTLVKLIDFARLTLRDPLDPAFDAAAAIYALEAPPSLLPLVADCLTEGAAEAKHDGTIDFTDMIWLPERWNLQVDKYPHVYIDEAQDLNAAQFALICRSRTPNARGLLVGDPDQAIYAFSFSDLNSFNTAKSYLNAIDLPLSICYRCPTSHLDLARELVPHILPRDDAPVGEVIDCWTDDLLTSTQPNDLVLCRYTAPLITQALRFLRARVRAYVKGRDIGVAMVKLIETIRKRNANLAAFQHTITEYATDQHDRLYRRRASQTIHDMLDDRILGVCIVHELSQPTDWADMIHTATDLCADDGTGVCLSTVHRAKGLEADRVWILHPEELGKRRPGMRGVDQESNIRYIALTRSRQFLGFVYGDPNL